MLGLPLSFSLPLPRDLPFCKESSSRVPYARQIHRLVASNWQQPAHLTFSISAIGVSHEVNRALLRTKCRFNDPSGNMRRATPMRDVLWESLAARFLAAVDVAVELCHSSRSLELEAEVQELLQQTCTACQRGRFVMQDQGSPCLQALLCASIHHSCQSSPHAEHHQHVAQLCRARCFGRSQRRVEHQSS